MAQTLRFEIVTPEKVIFSENVETVSLPGTEGELGIYPGHAPLMIQIDAGEVTVMHRGENRYLAVGTGFVEITNRKVSVLTDMAQDADQIDEQKVEEARQNAERRLAEKLSPEEQTAVQLALTHSLAQLKVKRRRRR